MSTDIYSDSERTTKRGQCGDCAQGIQMPVHNGFALYQEDGTGFWYCLYCGSNNVTIMDEESNVIFRQGDLYDGRQ